MTNAFFERFNSLSNREKITFFITLLISIWGTWDTFFYLPLANQQKQLTTELDNIELQLTAHQQAMRQIEAQKEIDPNEADKNTLKKLKTELGRLKQQLHMGDKQFVPAHLMASVLQDMLKKNNGLKLIQLETLAVSPFSEAIQGKSWVYHHGLSITFTANYFNTLNYLKSLESLPWRFNWNSIDYQVKEYPIAETTLRVYTLSFEENWLGL